MHFDQQQPGLFVVHYEDRNDLEPAKQEGLVAAIKKAGAKRSCAIVFVVGEHVSVDLSVPAYWLKVTADPAARLVALAVASRSFSVAIATKGFAVRNRLLGIPIAVRHFDAEADAVQWATAELTGSPRPDRPGPPIGRLPSSVAPLRLIDLPDHLEDPSPTIKFSMWAISPRHGSHPPDGPMTFIYPLALIVIGATTLLPQFFAFDRLRSGDSPPTPRAKKPARYCPARS